MLQIAIDKLKQHKSFMIVFVGGSHDGEVRDVERIPPVVRMPVQQSEIDARRGGDVPPIQMGCEQYKRLELHVDLPSANLSSNTVAVLYTHEALTGAEVLNILLTRYAQGAEKKQD